MFLDDDFYVHIFLPEFHCLLKDEVMSHPLTGDDLMISGDVASPPSPPPPDSHLITAQVEGTSTTLTQTQYTTISSLICSLFCLPTAALVYDGHTCNPLTLHWHYTAGEREKIEPTYSTGLLSEMAVPSRPPQWQAFKLSVQERKYNQLFLTDM